MASLALVVIVSSCEFIRMKNEQTDASNTRKAVARVHNSFLYKDELIGIIPAGTLSEDSVARVTTYVKVNSEAVGYRRSHENH